MSLVPYIQHFSASWKVLDVTINFPGLRKVLKNKSDLENCWKLNLRVLQKFWKMKILNRLWIGIAFCMCLI